MKKFLTFVMALAFFVPLLNLNICLASNIPHVHFDENLIVKPKPLKQHGREEEEEEEEEALDVEANEEEEEEEAPDVEAEEEEVAEKKAFAQKKEDSMDAAPVVNRSEINNFSVSDWDKECNYDNIPLEDIYNAMK